MGLRVVATGSYVPDGVVSNEHLRERLGCDSEWIIKRTGILERRHALPHQATSDLCYEAAQRCIEQAGVKPSDIDTVTGSPTATSRSRKKTPGTPCQST